MRHRRMKRKLGFKTAHKEAVMRNMMISLLDHGRIITTVPRAKEVRRITDKMITLAKDGSLHARRQAFAVIKDRKVLGKLFDEWGQKFEGRSGGYSRIIKMGQRRGDGAFLSVIEMATESLERPKAKLKGKKVSPSVAPVPSSETIIPEAKPEVIEEKVASEVEELSKAEVESEEEVNKGIQGETAQLVEGQEEKKL